MHRAELEPALGEVAEFFDVVGDAAADAADNFVVICSIENIDPMGVHTGDSITVAPALTLTDKEYQIMRNASIAVLREIGVEASAEERDTRGFISMTTSRPSATRSTS